MTISLEHVGLILAPTFRSRAYLQMFAARGIDPGLVMFLPGNEPQWDGPQTLDFAEYGLSFRAGVGMRETAKSSGWRVVDLPSADVNAGESVDLISRQNVSVMVYSGFAKVLVGRELLRTGKKLIHAHGGYLPEYRGATGFYFGLLREGKLGVTAFWMDDGIDTGAIVMRAWYNPAEGVEIDRVMDPVLRADLLARIFEYYAKNGSYPSVAPQPAFESHYVIHPVLKSLSLRYVKPRQHPAKSDK